MDVKLLVYYIILFVYAANSKTITNGRERRRLSALVGIVHLVAGKHMYVAVVLLVDVIFKDHTVVFDNTPVVNTY